MFFNAGVLFSQSKSTEKNWFLAFYCGGSSLLIHHKLGKTNLRLNQKHLTLGPVVGGPISDNPGLNFNLGFFSFLLHFQSRIIFPILFRASNHQVADQKN